MGIAINNHLCDNGVGTYGISLDGVQPEVRCSCKAELEDGDALMQPARDNTLPEQRCVACPKGTRFDVEAQVCRCGDGALPIGIDCQSSPGDRIATCACPPGTQREGDRCVHPGQTVCFDAFQRVTVGTFLEGQGFHDEPVCNAAFPDVWQPYPNPVDGPGIYCIDNVTSLFSAASLGLPFTGPVEKCQAADSQYLAYTSPGNTTGALVGSQGCESGGWFGGCGCVSASCARVNQQATAAHNGGKPYEFPVSTF